MRSFNPARLRSYLARNYRGPDMVVAAAGAVEHAQIVAEAETPLRQLQRPGGAAAASRRISAAAPMSRPATSSRRISRWRSKACRSRDDDIYSLQVFTNVLGGGMSSRLFQEVREKRGLCYTMHAFHMPYSDTGLFGLYAGTDAKDAPELMRVVIDEITRRRRDQRDGNQPRQGADEGRPADGAGKLGSARRATGAPDAGLWPADPARRRSSPRSTRSRSKARAPRAWR